MNDVKLYESIAEIKEDFPIKVRRYSSRFLKPHWHEHIELLHLLDGSGEFSCSAKISAAHSGETIIVNSNELHSFEAGSTIDYICIIISPTIFDNPELKNIVLESKISEDAFITRCFKRIYDAYTADDVCSSMVIKGEVYLLLAYLIKNHTAAHLSQFEYDVRIGRMKRINMILDYIHENYNRPLTTADLAEKWYISETHLCKIFKRSVGMTVLEYLNSFRIDKAEMLLRSSGSGISEIAQSVGFDNLNYFDRIFKKYKGMPPQSFRRSGGLCDVCTVK